MEEKWKLVQKTLKKTSEQILSKRKGSKKQCITNDILEKIDRRKEIKLKLIKQNI